MELYVDLGAHSYSIYIENNILKDTGSYIEKVYSGKKIMIISDDNVFPLYGDTIVKTLEDKYEVHSLILPHGEPTKSFQSLPKIYSALLEARFSRSDLIIALGGGVIGDLAGFAAASFLRGIKFIQIPTSLLAQVDSSVGGKVAVDLPEGKNLVGAFYINDGMGEVIKYGCIWDADLFKNLEAHTSFEDLKKDLTEVIYRCVDIKRIVVEHDQFDTGERMLLNFGHTLAHTIEQHYHYTRESHGEAVAIGMYQITKIAEEMGLTKPGEAEHIRKVLDIYGLPHKCDLMLHDLIEAIALDKKNLGGKLNVVLLKEIGKSYTYPTTTEFFTEHDRMV